VCPSAKKPPCTLRGSPIGVAVGCAHNALRDGHFLASMMIDAYDVLGLDLNAGEEDIKKAYKRMSLQCHPDKVQAQGGANSSDVNERFNEIKAAKEILSDPDRRKVYDSFGIDLGEERPEMEVWAIGAGNVLQPMGVWTLKTIFIRLGLWFVDWRWIGWALLLAGLVVAGLYAVDFRYREQRIRSEEALPLLLYVGIVDAVVMLQWLMPLLADTVILLALLVFEITGLAVFIENRKAGVATALAGLFVSWLAQGRWFWVIVIEVVFMIILLISMTVAAGIMRLWLENVYSQRADRVKDWRMRMRSRRKEMEDEIAVLRRKVKEHESARGNDGGAAPTGKNLSGKSSK